MPAVSTTSVSPADMMNSGTAWRSTLMRLFQVRKYGDRIDRVTISAVRATSRDSTTNSRSGDSPNISPDDRLATATLMSCAPGSNRG